MKVVECRNVTKRFKGRAVLEEYEEHARTFLLSTHLIDEMMNLFTDIVIMENGNVIVQEQVDTLHSKCIKVTGNLKQVDVVKEKQKIGEYALGNSITRMYYDSFTQEELSIYQANGLRMEGMTLQEIFVALSIFYRRDSDGRDNSERNKENK